MTFTNAANLMEKSSILKRLSLALLHKNSFIIFKVCLNIFEYRFLQSEFCFCFRYVFFTLVVSQTPPLIKRLSTN